MNAAYAKDDASMASKHIFQILKPAAKDAASARLGRLSVAGRKPIETPNLIASTSRGAVPHLTQDNVLKHTSFGAGYMGLEDFIERKDPPIYDFPRGELSRLHGFTCFPRDRVTVLGPRRCPAALTPTGNVAHCMSLWTSTGFLSLPITDFTSAVTSLEPDIVVGPGDLPFLKQTPHSKKLLRMVERTEEWMEGFLKSRKATEQATGSRISVFAPVLPVELPIQWQYLRNLAEDDVEALSGLAVYDANMLPELASFGSFSTLPKLSIDPPKSPREILRQVSLGMDLLTIPFINNISDAGIALSFTFPAPPTEEELPLGINMWESNNQTALTPLVEGCECYACTVHHRAFLQHLLNAKEMLGWNLLQVHNHSVVDRFFQGIRETIAQGADVFEQACDGFARAYEPELPVGTGLRPRARGHHFKSEADQKKINPPAWSNLDGEARTTGPTPGSGTETLRIPDESGAALLEKKRFAEGR